MNTITVTTQEFKQFEKKVRKAYPQANFAWLAWDGKRYNRFSLINVTDGEIIGEYSKENKTWTIKAPKFFDLTSI